MRRIRGRKLKLVSLGIPAVLVAAFSITPAAAAGSDWAYAQRFQSNGVTNVYAPTQTSCYRPEVPYTTNAGPNDGFSGETACPGATTGEDTGATAPYATQVGSNPGFATGPSVLAKNHSESDIRADPTNASHLIGPVKWFASAEGYNHELGFYESFDGGVSWPVQGHIPGYEGWTDNTDPVGAFDGFGNYYELILPYQFFYNADGSHSFQTNPNKEPNDSVPAEVISIAVRPHGSSNATQCLLNHTTPPRVPRLNIPPPYPPNSHTPHNPRT